MPHSLSPAHFSTTTLLPLRYLLSAVLLHYADLIVIVSFVTSGPLYRAIFFIQFSFPFRCSYSAACQGNSINKHRLNLEGISPIACIVRHQYKLLGININTAS
jgi:hypothetical protein